METTLYSSLYGYGSHWCVVLFLLPRGIMWIGRGGATRKGEERVWATREDEGRGGETKEGGGKQPRKAGEGEKQQGRRGERRERRATPFIT